MAAITDPQRLLTGLSAPQRAAVTSPAGLLCVVAGAGSGKTTVLTRRVAWRVLSGAARADHVLVVTFTRKAATELRARLERLGVGGGVWAATFHSAAYRMLRRHWADEGRPAPALISDPNRLLRRLLEEDPGADAAMIPMLAAELSWARARLIGAEHYPHEASRARRWCPLPAERVAHLMVRYEEEKRRRHVIDLDDLVLRCAELIETGGVAAEAVGWYVGHLFVDEFQDVNPAQWRLLQAWRRGRPDLCVVGDPRQAIYAFNGSDPSLLGRLPELVPGTEVLHLHQNHRSSRQIVAAAGAVLADELDELTSPWAAVDAEGPVPQLRGFADQASEADAVVRWVRTTRRPGQPWRQLAVLARTNARLDAVAEALDRAGIPGRRAASVAGRRQLDGVLRSLRTMDRGVPLRAAVVDVMAEFDATVLSHPRDGARPEPSDPGRPSAGEISAHLERLVEEHAGDEDRPTVGSFLNWMTANRAETDAAGAVDAVELATFHQAKGLEWRSVAVVGLEDGTMPIAYAVDAAARAEERRLLYVALTRPEEHLWCSWAAAVEAGGTSRNRGPSPFLDRLRSVLDHTEPSHPVNARGRVSELRRRLASVG